MQYPYDTIASILHTLGRDHSVNGNTCTAFGQTGSGCCGCPFFLDGGCIGHTQMKTNQPTQEWLDYLHLHFPEHFI